MVLINQSGKQLSKFELAFYMPNGFKTQPRFVLVWRRAIFPCLCIAVAICRFLKKQWRHTRTEKYLL